MIMQPEFAKQSTRMAIARIAQLCPDLVMRDTQRDGGDLEWVLPVQPGLDHEIVLSLSNLDELHFVVGNFWIEYFPCTDTLVADVFVDAVSGFIDGRYRVLEHYRGKVCVRADLQKPEAGGWQTLSTWTRLHWPFPLSKTYKSLTNGALR